VLTLVFVILIVLIMYNDKVGFKQIVVGNIYEARATFVNDHSGKSRLLGYAYGWLGGMLTPILFVVGLYLRNYLMIILGLASGLFNFFIAGQKWALASLFVSLFLLAVGKNILNKNNSSSKVIGAFGWLVSGSLIFGSILGNASLYDLIVRRSLVDPAIMFQYYVKYTLDYPFSWWSDSLIGKALDINSREPVSNIIGDRYFNIPHPLFLERPAQANATSGAIADSIAQAGILGIFLTCILLFLFFRLLDELAHARNGVLVFVICGISVELLIEGTLHTLALSRGLILVPFLFMLLPRDP
jgi:hypothetical protein